MGRPLKKGLDYFPYDTSILEDNKIRLLRARFGLKGLAIYTILLCRVYRDKGYYMAWGTDEALLFANEVGDGTSIALVNDVVNELFKRDLFDKAIFERFGILTSKGIQERYQHICRQLKRPFEIVPEHDCRNIALLKQALSTEKQGFPPEETPKIREESTQRKGKEKKGNENEEEAPSPSGFLKRLFSDLGDADRENICIQIRKQAINPQWAVQFNAHLHTQSKVHPNYERWLSHFTAWLSKRSAELAAESTVNAIQKSRKVWE